MHLIFEKQKLITEQEKLHAHKQLKKIMKVLGKL